MTYALLGFDSDGNRIEVGKKERPEHMAVFGTPGKGKSVLAANLILHDIKENNTGVIVIDPNRDLITEVIGRMPKERLKDVVLLDIDNTDFPFGLNIYECPDPTDIKELQYTMDGIMRVWDRLFEITRENPLVSNQLRNAAHLIIANPGYTLADIPFIYDDGRLRRKLLANVTDRYVKSFWERFEHLNKIDRDRQVDAVTNKFNEYVQPMVRNIVGQSKSTINLRELIDAVPRKIILLQLDPQLQATDSLIGGTLLSMILQAFFARGDGDDRKQVHIYCDEGQYFATNDMAQLVNEGRKYGCGVCFLTQSRIKLLLEIPEFARGILGAATTCVFQSTPEDSEEFSGKFDHAARPGQKQEKQLKSPMYRPVNFMADHGVHPCDTTREFMRKYGKKLVDEARIEEQIEGESRRELVSMAHNSSRYGPGSAVVVVTHDKRERLEWLNDLLHDAMIAGKQRISLDDVTIDIEGLDNLLKRIATGKAATFFALRDKYFAWKEQYLKDIPVHFLEPTERIRTVKDEPEKTPLQIEAKNRSLWEQDPVRQQVETACREYVVKAIREFHESTAIVEQPNNFKKFLIPERRYTTEEKYPFYIEEEKDFDFIGCSCLIGLILLIVVSVLLCFTFFVPMPTLLSPTIAFGVVSTIVIFILISSAKNYNGGGYWRWRKAAEVYFYRYKDSWLHIDKRILLNRNNWIRRKRKIWWGKGEMEKIRSIYTWQLRPETVNTLFSKHFSDNTLNQYLDAFKLQYGKELAPDNLLHQDIYENFFRSKRNIYLPSHVLKRNKTSILEEAENQWISDLTRRIYEITAIKEQWLQRQEQIPQELDLLQAIMAYKYDYDIAMEDLRAELLQLMKDLYAFPVEAPNGIYQDEPGPEIASTEVRSRVANKLSQLPKLTAHVRLASFPPNLKTKVCHSCKAINPTSAIICTSCQLELQPEYIITVKPQEYRVKQSEIEERTKFIVENNVKQGYLRPREEVEEEIRRRQEPDDPPPTSPASKQPKPPTQHSAGSSGKLPDTQKPTQRKRIISDLSESA